MTHDEMRRRLDDFEKRLQELEGKRLMPTVRARPTDRFPTLHADRERPGAALGVMRKSELDALTARLAGSDRMVSDARLAILNARLEGDDADDGA